MTNRRRGFSLVELMIVTAMTSLLIGILGYIYVWVSGKSAQTYAQQAVIAQSSKLSDEIENTVANAVSCTVTANLFGSSMRCIMPENAADTNGDGVDDKWGPKMVTPRGQAKYGANGKRVWFYFSDSTGNYGATPGAATKYFYRAVRADASNPTLANADNTFRNNPGGGFKWNLVSAVTFTTDAPNKLITMKIKAANVAYAIDRRASSVSSQSREYELDRTVFMQHWRK
ncbi:MAG: prepilin-type N-terminal cleavage/methylation domain-containing protein [Fimbriimonadaceae bacterium]